MFLTQVVEQMATRRAKSAFPSSALSDGRDQVSIDVAQLAFVRCETQRPGGRAFIACASAVARQGLRLGLTA
jgi:hypothetical protein